MKTLFSRMAVIVLVVGLLAGVAWLEWPTPPAPKPLAAPVDEARLAEAAIAAYREEHEMAAAGKAGQWKFDASASNGGGEFVGVFGPLVRVRDAAGQGWLLTTLNADTAESAGDGMDSFAASGVNRMLLFALRDGQYRLAAEEQLEMGTNGMAGSAKVAQLGPRQWGWVLQGGYLQQGYSATNVHFFRADGGKIRSMGTLVSEADNSGACGEQGSAACPLTALKVEWRWQQVAGDFWPLQVSWRGKLEGRAVTKQLSLLPNGQGEYPFPQELNIQF